MVEIIAEDGLLKPLGEIKIATPVRINHVNVCSIIIYQHKSILFINIWFYVTFNTVQVISRQVVGRAEESSTYSLLGFCTVNC